MTVRVQQIDGEFRIVLTPEMMESLHLTEGAEVSVAPAAKDIPKEQRYASPERVLEAFHRTEQKFRESYRELAK